MDVSWVLSWVLELECTNRNTACLGELSALSPGESQPPAAKIPCCSTWLRELLFRICSEISSFCRCGLMKRLGDVPGAVRKVTRDIAVAGCLITL